MVSTVHEHGFVQSRHPGCSFWRKSCQPWKCKGRLEGWGSLLTTEAKNMAFFFCFFCALIHCKPSPVQQNSSKDNTAQGKSKHCWLDRCGNVALVHWWHVVKKKGIEVHFLVNGSEAGNEQRWWSHVKDCEWSCWGMSSILWEKKKKKKPPDWDFPKVP